MTAFQPSPLAEVKMLARHNRWTLVFTRELRHPPERVWSALTEPAQLRLWSPFTADRELSRPGDLTMTMIDGDATDDVAASVTRAEPHRTLEYTWGGELIRWELAPTPAGTRLTLRHTMSDRKRAAGYAAGWHMCLDVEEHLLDDNPIAPIRGKGAMDFGWDQLNSSYARALETT